MGKKRIMIIAGGEWQVPVIRKAQQMGLEVLVTDRGGDAPGMKIADLGEVVDIIDREGTLAAAKKHNIHAVITEQTDVSVPTAAYVAESLGLIGIGYEVALRCSNKYMMREACRKADIPMPKYEKVDAINQALDAAAHIQYPVVIKPVDGQASRGVKRIENPQELRQFFPAAKAQSREGGVMVEECLFGIETTVEGFVVEGEPFVLAMSDKKHLPPPVCVAYNLTYPPAFEAQTKTQLRTIAERTVKALGIPMGIFHGEFMVTNEGIKFIELAARGGGSRISTHIIPAVSGIDVVEGLILQALGKPFTLEKEKITHRAAMLEFFVPSRGTVKAIRGVEEARKLSGVMEIKFQIKEGDELEIIDNDRIRPGFFTIEGDSRQQVSHIAAQVRKLVEIVLE